MAKRGRPKKTIQLAAKSLMASNVKEQTKVVVKSPTSQMTGKEGEGLSDLGLVDVRIRTDGDDLFPGTGRSGAGDCSGDQSILLTKPYLHAVPTSVIQDQGRWGQKGTECKLEKPLGKKQIVAWARKPMKPTQELANHITPSGDLGEMHTDPSKGLLWVMWRVTINGRM
ncbi:hypothetical protein Dimus_028594 [Dionaea muscipula]